MKKMFVFSVLLASLIFAVSCSSKKKSEEKKDPVVKEEVAQEISAEEGGTIKNSDESVSIEIPGNALENDTKITMKIYDAKDYKGTEGKDFISKVVEFEPSGIIFKKPVIITMKSLKDVENKIITAAVFREEKGEWSYSPTGAAVKIAGYDEGGDPIMQSAGGDPIMLSAGGDPIMMDDGGDPIMLSAGGDPIMITAGGDPIMHSDGGDPIMMTTGHFTAYAFIALETNSEETPDNEPSETDDTDDSATPDAEITDEDEPVDDGDSTEPDEEQDSEITDNETADEEPDSEDADPLINDDDIIENNPCEGNPCLGIANSTENCIVTTTNDYECGCNEGYFWNENGCKKQVSIGNICTGQNKCYGTTTGNNEIACPAEGEDFYGQDAQYAALGKCTPQSFTVQTISGDNIVVDNNTGLMWQQSPEEETYTWGNAVIYCNDLTYAGYDDWRLPSPMDFWTIVDNSESVPKVDTTYFPNMPLDSYHLWTNKEWPEDTSQSWAFFSSDSAGMGRSVKTDSYSVVCVRGNELPKAVLSTQTISEEVVVKDAATGLMWQKSYVEDKVWQDALSYCENIEYAGFSDWRLPNIKELESLVDFEKVGAPYSNFPDLTSDNSGDFWSSTTHLNSNQGEGSTTTISNASTMNFRNIFANSISKWANKNVLCVR